HGNDPTFRGSDHTREHTPILCFGPKVAAKPLGRRESLADIAASVAVRLEIGAGGAGTSWW
ncbi:MAG: phosphopentomutase, partial [Hyphomicrobiales bacterium]|nr:phosphopentomutase [Hyphomicrobiales bacterium]